MQLARIVLDDILGMSKKALLLGIYFMFLTKMMLNVLKIYARIMV